MKIKTLHFRHFGGFDISFEKELTVLVTRNGEGKTSVLDALALSLGHVFNTCMRDMMVQGMAIGETRETLIKVNLRKNKADH